MLPTELMRLTPVAQKLGSIRYHGIAELFSIFSETNKYQNFLILRCPMDLLCSAFLPCLSVSKANAAKKQSMVGPALICSHSPAQARQSNMAAPMCGQLAGNLYLTSQTKLNITYIYLHHLEFVLIYNENLVLKSTEVFV